MTFTSWLHSCVHSPVGWMLAAVWGLLWGSFANVCIARIPYHQSIVWPGSHCPACKVKLAWYDNIPLFSWLWLGRACRHCQKAISFQYPLVEMVTSLWHVGLFFLFLWPHATPLAFLQFFTYGFFGVTLLVLGWIDARHLLLPNAITYPAIPVFFLLGRFLPDVSLLQASIGLLSGYLIVRLLADGYRLWTGREGLGYGDGKLLALVGGLLGWQAVVSSLFLGSLLALLFAVPWMLYQRRHSHKTNSSWRHTPIPFGPFLVLGALFDFVFVISPLFSHRWSPLF